MKLDVYKITNKVNNKIYIGITNQGVKTRWYKHCSEAKKGSTTSLHRAILKYSKLNFQIETIEEIKGEDYDYLKEREMYWVKYFDSYNRDKGYNLTLGGDGTFGRFHTDETKEKIRQKALGHEVSEETRAKMSETHQNREYDHDEMSARAIKGNEVRWADPEQHKKASLNNPNNKIILQYDLEMNFIAKYRSLSEAAKAVGGYHQNISKCASGKPNHKTSAGFIWRFT